MKRGLEPPPPPAAKQARAFNPYLAHLDAEEDTSRTKRHVRPFAPVLAQGELAKRATEMQKSVARVEYKLSKQSESKLKDMSVKAAAPGVSSESGQPLAVAAASLTVTPSMERWDLPYLPKTMRERPAGERPDEAPYEALSTTNSKAVLYVEHPVPLIPTAASTESTAPLPMFSTKEEQKRLRRKNREQRTQEKRDMIAVGLLPPPPPKVKLSNLMRVLTTEATLNPSEIEARVKQEIAQRIAQGQARNDAKKLTPEEKLAKQRRKNEADAAKGLVMAVFRLNNITAGEEEVAAKRRSKMLATGADLGLTGRLIIVAEANKPSMVIVEGGPGNVRRFCRLMLRRIPWSANTELEVKGLIGNSRGNEGDIDDDDGDGDAGVQVDQSVPRDGAIRASCDLTWRGPVARREFDRLKMEAVDTVQDAQRILHGKNIPHMWESMVKFDPSMGGVATDDL